MPKLKEVEVDYDQIRDLVYQLTFSKKIDLLREIIRDKNYQEDFYLFTESLVKKYKFSNMSELELVPCLISSVLNNGKIKFA